MSVKIARVRLGQLLLLVAFIFCGLASVAHATSEVCGAPPAGTCFSLFFLFSFSFSFSFSSFFPSVRPKYLRSDHKFRCLDGTTLFDIAVINDDFCDCADGSDEPGTTPCPNGSFHCKNEGFNGAVIRSSRVNDGICGELSSPLFFSFLSSFFPHSKFLTPTTSSLQTVVMALMSTRVRCARILVSYRTRPREQRPS